MSASDEQIRAVAERYVELIGNGTADEITALYADGATVEDPVGSDPYVGKEAIHGFYSAMDGMTRSTKMLAVRIAGGRAAFNFEVRTPAGDATVVICPIDVMTFDDDAKVTSMQAYWGPADIVME